MDREELLKFLTKEHSSHSNWVFHVKRFNDNAKELDLQGKTILASISRRLASALELYINRVESELQVLSMENLDVKDQEVDQLLDNFFSSIDSKKNNHE